jgi:hypothetical protein
MSGYPAARPRFAHDGFGLLVGDRASEPPEGFPAAGQSRADRSDRHIKNRGNLFVPHPFQSDEQNDRALFFRKPSNRALQITQFEPPPLLWRTAQHRLGFDQGNRGAFPHRTPDVIYILIMQDREQPSAKIGSLLPQVDLAERARQAILYEIVGDDHVARKCPCVPPQARDFGFDSVVSIGHRQSPCSFQSAATADPTGPNVLGEA